MLDDNGRAVIGGNHPPVDPIEACMDEFGDIISEAQNWADGTPPETEDQMKALDLVIKGFKPYCTALDAAASARTKPMHDAWKAEIKAVNIYVNDAALMKKALVDLGAPFKVKLAAEKEAEKRAAWEVAEKARRAAEALEKEARAGDIDQARAAAAAKEAALEATKAAQAKTKDTVKGMRKVSTFVIDDHKAAFNDIIRNDSPAITAFIEAYVQSNFKVKKIDGVTVTHGKEAY